MLPILIKIGPITIRTYGFLLAVGVLSAVFILHRMSKKEGFPPETVSNLAFFSILSGLIGAKLFLLVTEFGYYMKHPADLKYLITSAGTFYGGLIFGVLFAAWYIRKHRLDFRRLVDIAGPAIALAHFFGRLGCFSAGCCWGREAENCSLAVQFSHADIETGVPLHTPLYPTQLIESLLNLLNFVFLILFYKKKKFAGQVFALYIFNYSLIRFAVEFFRGDSDRGYVFGSMNEPFTSLSVPQLISIIGIGTAIVLYRVFKKQAANG